MSEHDEMEYALNRQPDGDPGAYEAWYSAFKGKQVLVAEDVAIHADQVRGTLLAAGCARVDLVTNGTDALNTASTNRYDLLVLDIRMPGLDGLSVLRKLRAGSGPNRNAVCVFLTATTDPALRREAVSTVSGLRAEAFLLKPVPNHELIARLGQELERWAQKNEPEIITNGPVRVEALACSVSIAGFPVELSANHFSIVWLLALNAGKPVTRDMIAMAGWREKWRGNDYLLDEYRNGCISTAIRRIRKAFSEAAPANLLPLFEGKNFLVSAPNEGLRMIRLD